MTAYMRGNEAMIGLYGDTFAFTFIREFAALLLGVEIGMYAHHVGSVDINALDIPKVERILAERTVYVFPHAAMPAGTSWADLRSVLDWEQRLRINQDRFTNRRIGGRSPAEYVKTIETAAGIGESELDKILATHLVDPAALRPADFKAFFAARRGRLLALIGEAMGKKIMDTEADNAADFVEETEDSTRRRTHRRVRQRIWSGAFSRSHSSARWGRGARSFRRTAALSRSRL